MSEEAAERRRESSKLRMRRRADARRALGVCMRCNDDNLRPIHRKDLCREHYDLYSDWQTRRKIERKELGLCQVCPRASARPVKEGTTICREHLAEHAERAKQRARTDKGRNAARALKRKQMYGMTQEEYDTLLRRQHDVCAICKRPETSKRHGKVLSLSVDHNHATGKVRGLLCFACNTGIALLHENVDNVSKAILYLESGDA